MENKTKSKTKNLTNIEIVYGDKEDLIRLASREEFIEFILVDSLETITKAMCGGIEKVELFNILNLSLIIELESSNFKPVLERITQHYLKVEDYKQCSKIQKLIDKL
jgi:hypothetical protein